LNPEASASALQSHETSEFRFMARQPILNKAKQLYGYELLFRSGPNYAFADLASEGATQSVLDLSLVLGAGSFTDGYRAFINCTRIHLSSGVLRTLPKDLVVLEVLEDVPADEEVLNECHKLKAEGYTIAVDDIVSAEDRIDLISLADIIKVDWQHSDERQQKEIARRFARSGVQLLAEKVETHEQFQAALKMGYTLFQGYFFCRPETLRAKALPSAHLGYLDILRQAFQPEVDIQEMARAIRKEPSLTYRLLRFINAAGRGNYQVESIVQALGLLGRDEIRKWVSIVAAIGLAGPRSKELIRIALIRARFCEQVARHLNVPVPDYYLTGLFSLLDALLDRPLKQILAEIPIPSSCREALNGATNGPGNALRLAVASESGDWPGVTRYCGELKCGETDAWHWEHDAQTYVSKLRW
jgi:EAL and modified HD-GYP domain-containing signal transduction protein